MLILLATLLCLSSEPANDVDYIHEVDGYVEINTYIGQDSSIILKQVIIRRWINELQGHHVVHWLLIDKDYEPSVRKLADGKYRVVVHQRKNESFIIDCNSVHHTITEHDPELADRQKLSKENRHLFFNQRKGRGIQRFKPVIVIGEPRFN